MEKINIRNPLPHRAHHSTNLKIWRPLHIDHQRPHTQRCPNSDPRNPPHLHPATSIF